MFASVVIGVFVLIIAIIVYVEYKNEKTYQEERKHRAEARRKSKPSYKPEEKIQKPEQKKKETVPKRKASVYASREPVVSAVKKEEKKYDLPACEYPKFDYSRLLKMGLSEEEAIEFGKELIPQIKAQIPLIKEAMGKEDFHTMERLTHSIKGSSTTVGTGGISDLLSEFNTYLKTGKEIAVAEAYFKHLNRYAEALEKQFA